MDKAKDLTVTILGKFDISEHQCSSIYAIANAIQSARREPSVKEISIVLTKPDRMMALLDEVRLIKGMNAESYTGLNKLINKYRVTGGAGVSSARIKKDFEKVLQKLAHHTEELII